MKILFLGDIVGRPGRDILSRQLGGFRKEYGIDLCVANGENAAGGSGITPTTGGEIFGAGVDVITTGDHIWKRKESRQYLNDNSNVLRPANMPEEAPGSGHTIVNAGDGTEVGVINVQGRTFMSPTDCPFHAVERSLKALSERVRIIVVDIHAEATSDKMAMGRFLDGRVTAVLGTHTHVQTADEQVFPGGTAYITDVGMVGPYESILGRCVESVVSAFSTQLPTRFEVATGDVRMGGVFVEADPATGKALSIERVMKRYETA